jgi:hypothetical protein
MRLALEGGRVLVRPQVVAVAKVDVARSAERGEAETEPAQLRRTKSIATGTPSSLKRSRTWFSTQ